MDANKAANALINAVAFVVESVMGLIFSVSSRLAGKSENAPKFKLEGTQKKLVAFGALAAIAIAPLSLLFTMSDHPPEDDYTVPRALGLGVAEETCRLLGNKGRIVVVRMQGQGTQLRNAEAQIQTFLETLSSQGGVNVAGTEALVMQLVPAGPPQIFSGEMYSSILAKYPEVSAIVSLVGTPLLRDEEIVKLPPNRPKLIVLGGGADLGRLLDDGVVQMAIVARPNARSKFEEQKKKPKSLRACFDQLYQVMTAETPPPTSP